MTEMREATRGGDPGLLGVRIQRVFDLGIPRNTDIEQAELRFRALLNQVLPAQQPRAPSSSLLLSRFLPLLFPLPTVGSGCIGTAICICIV